MCSIKKIQFYIIFCLFRFQNFNLFIRLSIIKEKQNVPSSTLSNTTSTKKKLKEGRFPVNPGITGYVAATGETINILDAYEDNRFDPKVNKE